MNRWVIAACLLLPLRVSYGLDLLESYRLALASHPKIREMQAAYDAAQAARSLAMSTFLPQVEGSLDGRYDHSSYSQDYPTSTPGAGRSVTNDVITIGRTGMFTVSVQQSLFSPVNRTAGAYAGVRVSQADTEYRAAVQAVMLEVVTNYLSILAYQESLDAQLEAKRQLEQQWQQAVDRREVGMLASTDVVQAQAAFEAAQAAVLDAENQLEAARIAFRQLVGVDPGRLAPLPQTFRVDSPEPADLSAWLKIASTTNPTLRSSRLSIDLAALKVSAEQDARWPRLTAQGFYSTTAGEGTGVTIIRDYDSREVLGRLNSPPVIGRDDWGIHLQLTMPLFSGGAISARVRAALAEQRSVEQRGVSVQRDIDEHVQRAYTSVLANIRQIEAATKALATSMRALELTEGGYDIGTRSAAELLQMRRQLLESRLTLARGKVSYLMGVLDLQYASGVLSIDSLEQVAKRLSP